MEEARYERRCYMCGARLTWESEADFDDVGESGQGIISYYRCTGCGAWYEIWVPLDESEGEQ